MSSTWTAAWHMSRFKAEMARAFQGGRPPDPASVHARTLPDTEDPRGICTEAVVVGRLFFLNCMGEDEPTGGFSLDDDDELDLEWCSKPGDQKVFVDIQQLLIVFLGAMGGGYAPASCWRGFFDDNTLTITHRSAAARPGRAPRPPFGTSWRSTPRSCLGRSSRTLR